MTTGSYLTPSRAQQAGPMRVSTRPVSEGGRRLLDATLRTGLTTQADLSRRLDLAQSTVTRLIQGFERDGMIDVQSNSPGRGALAAGPGHPSVRISLRGDFAFSIGVSLMGDVVSMAIVDFAGRLLGTRQAAMPVMTRSAVCDQLSVFKRELLDETAVDPKRVIGAGAGISGFYVGERKWINPPAYLDEWALVDIEPILEACLDLPVMFDNDGSAAAVGEALYGLGRQHRDFAYLHITNGFGGGVISDGRLFPGAHGNVGDFAAVWTAMGIEVPTLDLLRRRVAEHGVRFETVEAMVGQIDLETPGVDQWLAQASDAIAKLSMVLCACIDPSVIVIGGRTPSALAQALARKVQIPPATTRRNRPPPRPLILASQAPGDVVALGAAAMPMQRAFFS